MAMTKKDMIKEVGREIVTTSRDCASISKEIEKVRRTIEKLQEKRDKSRTQKTVQKNQELVDEARQDLARLESALSEAVSLRDVALARKKELEDLSDDPFQAIQSVSRDKSMPLSVLVKMMTGDILSVEIDFQDSIQHFPLQFAHQHQYNLSVVKSRMLFLIDDEKELLSGLKDGSTWSEEFKTEDDIPILHLFIRPEDENELSSKISLIYKILDDKKRKSLLSQDELSSKYSEWNLHYMPPPNSNRYLNLVAFVFSNSEYFPELSDEEMIDFEYEKKRQFFIKLRDKNNMLIQQRRRGITSIYISSLKNCILDILQRNSRFTDTAIRQFRCYLTIQEIIDLGVESDEMFKDADPNFIQLWKQFFPSS